MTSASRSQESGFSMPARFSKFFTTGFLRPRFFHIRWSPKRASRARRRRDVFKEISSIDISDRFTTDGIPHRPSATNDSLNAVQGHLTSPIGHCFLVAGSLRPPPPYETMNWFCVYESYYIICHVSLCIFVSPCSV